MSDTIVITSTIIRYLVVLSNFLLIHVFQLRVGDACAALLFLGERRIVSICYFMIFGLSLQSYQCLYCALFMQYRLCSFVGYRAFMVHVGFAHHFMHLLHEFVPVCCGEGLLCSACISLQCNRSKLFILYFWGFCYSFEN